MENVILAADFSSQDLVEIAEPLEPVCGDWVLHAPLMPKVRLHYAYGIRIRHFQTGYLFSHISEHLLNVKQK